MEFSVVVGTFGSNSWAELARKRAIPSAEAQGVSVCHFHEGTLAEARNAGLEAAETEYVIHLDADDELAPGYVAAMQEAVADVLVPAVTNVYLHRVVYAPHYPKVWGHGHECEPACLRAGNWIVVGAGVRRELALEVGGWEEFGWSEDWALWARCWKAGATFARTPGAVYRAFRRTRSRNRIRRSESVDWHRQIEAAVWPEEVSIL